MDHPAVELKLPLDGANYRVEIPRDTTLFFWSAVIPGMGDQMPAGDRGLSASQQRVLRALSNQGSCRVTLADESKPLLDEPYRTEEWTGRAWWIAQDPVALPATVSVEFTTTGERPTLDGEDAVLWTEQGEAIPWGSTIESEIELVPSSRRASEFPTRQERLWHRHSVYVPDWQPTSDSSPSETPD